MFWPAFWCPRSCVCKLRQQGNRYFLRFEFGQCSCQESWGLSKRWEDKLLHTHSQCTIRCDSQPKEERTAGKAIGERPDGYNAPLKGTRQCFPRIEELLHLKQIFRSVVENLNWSQIFFIPENLKFARVFAVLSRDNVLSVHFCLPSKHNVCTCASFIFFHVLQKFFEHNNLEQSFHSGRPDFRIGRLFLTLFRPGRIISLKWERLFLDKRLINMI